MKYKSFIVKTGAALGLALAIAAAPYYSQAYTQISSNLKVGSKGTDVRSLQELLASDHDMYPSGSTDGIFGRNTRNAVMQFQIAYGLSADGVVGPVTRAKVNSLVIDGRGVDVSNAGITGLTTSGSNSSTEIVSFNASEPVKATIFYSTSPINWDSWNDEVMSLDTPNISGTANTDSSFSSNKQFTLSNLSANTTYNYVIVTTDRAGNQSATWPKTFKTNP